MAQRRRLALDAPARSANEEVGPHLLGRVYKEDPRDWTLEKLRTVADIPDSIMRKSVQDVMHETSYFSVWRDFLLLWRWLQSHQKPAPGPADTTPAWQDLIQLDQGQTGHCVGFGWCGWGDAAPVEDIFQNADGHALYYECKVIDGQPGAENGSAVRSGAIAMRNRGRLAAFAFAQSIDEINGWIDTQGSVVMGTDWTDGMFNPDSQGYVRPIGPIAGGHCYLMLDRMDQEDAYLFQNSWGLDWGDQGRFRMKRKDVEHLLAQQGEACLALELPK